LRPAATYVEDIASAYDHEPVIADEKAIAADYLNSMPPPVVMGPPAPPTVAMGPSAAMAAPAPTPPPAAAVMAAEPTYMLDSGDKRRVVFGQDGLSHSYAVDAAGNITMPLIGAVYAREHSTAELSQNIGAKLRIGYIREPHVAVEVARPIGRSSSSARSRRPASTPKWPT